MLIKPIFLNNIFLLGKFQMPLSVDIPSSCYQGPYLDYFQGRHILRLMYESGLNLSTYPPFNFYEVDASYTHDPDAYEIYYLIIENCHVPD